MDSPADDYTEFKSRLSSVPDDDLERIAAERYGREPNEALTVALREELSKRGLKVGPTPTAADEMAVLPCRWCGVPITANPAELCGDCRSIVPRPEPDETRVERGQWIRAERF